MNLQEQPKKITNKLMDCFVWLLRQDIWMGLLWICLGLASMWNPYFEDDFLTALGPFVVGVLLMIPLKQKDMVYFVGGFAVVVDRAYHYIVGGLWSPVITWMILGTYVITIIGRKPD